MPELRWLLLGLGVLVIAGIYFFSRRSTGTAKRSRHEPHIGAPAPESEALSSTDSFDILVEELTDVTVPENFQAFAESVSKSAAAEAGEDKAGAAGAESDQKIVVIHVAARSDHKMHGPDIVRVLDEEGLVHGRYRIFHRHPPTTGGGVNVSATQYSVACMTEPGAIPLDKLEEVHTSGLSFFMVLPGPSNGARVFSEMLETARRVSQALDADLLDEQGSTLSQQAAAHIREEVISFEHRLRRPVRS